MKSENAFQKTCVSALALLACCGLDAGARADEQAPTPQLAAAPPAGVNQIQEVVVTARARKESLQDVPVAITALNTQSLENQAVADVSDLEKYIPNVILQPNYFTGSGLNMSIRGNQFADLEKTFEPTVGVSLDGVFLATNTGMAIDTIDLDNIEVDRGPQGTLFGRNAIGGVIALHRTDPTGEFGGKIGIRTGEYNQQEYQLVLNSPKFLNDMVSVKIFGFENMADQFVRNLITNNYDRGKDQKEGGVSVKFDPTDNLDAVLTVDALTDRTREPPLLNSSVPSAQYTKAGGKYDGTTLCDIGEALLGSPNICSSQSYTLASHEGFQVGFNDIPFENYIDATSATLNLKWTLPGVNITAITGYRDDKELLKEENTGAPEIPIGGGVSLLPIVAVRAQEFHQFSQEMRADYQPLDNLKVVSGVYFLNDKYGINPSIFNGTSGEIFAFVPSVPVPGDTGLSQSFSAGQTLNAYAAFTEAVYNITDQLSVTGGFRYTYETKDFVLASYYQGPGTTPFVFNGSDSWGLPTGRFIVDYKFTDDALGYVSWSRGARSGGWNGRATTYDSVGPYQPETVDSFEIGAKTSWFGNRLRFNPDFFYELYDNKQEQILRATNNGLGTETVVQNAGSAYLYGFEADLTAKPIDGVTIRGSLGTLSSGYNTFIIPDLAHPGQTLNVANQRLLREAPDLTGLIGADYRIPVLDGSLTLSSNVSYTGEFFTSPLPDPFNRTTIHSHTETDFSGTLVEPLDDTRSVRLNAFINDAFAKNPARVYNTLDAGSFYFETVVPTTLWGVQASISF